MRKGILFFAGLLFLGVSFRAGAVQAAGGAPDLIEITLPSGWKVQAEPARTEQEKERGLMFRKAISPDRAMLFIYKDEGEREFWMKNTFIDLDIIFISGSGRITAIFNKVPRSYADTTDSAVARVRGKGMFVLETAAGFAREHRLWKGQKLKFETDKKKDDPGKPGKKRKK